jgi:copper resistance protein C
MFKKVSLFTFILLFTFVSAVFAHTGLESSNPQNGEVINDELKQITLTFEGKIEQGSTFTLQNANGEAIPVDNITIIENILTGDLSTPLGNGDYTVDWSIIGEDGHLIEEKFTFSIDNPNAETEVSTQTNKEDNEVNQANQTDHTEADEGNSNILPIIIGALIVIIIISFVFLARRKK